MLPYHIMSGYLLLTIAIWLNGLLIFLVRYYTRAPIGNYKYFLVGMAVYETIYAASYAFISPLLYTQPGILVGIPSNPLLDAIPKTNSQFLIIYMESTYAATMIMLASHFLYRYITMCRDEWMFLFETVHGLFLSGSVMFSLAFLWGLISGVFLSPTTERSRKLDPILRLHFNRTTKETAYTLVEYWDIETGAFVPLTWVALALIAAITATCFGCIFYCGYYTYAMMTSHQLHRSRQLELLQKQLFRSLIVLTMVPVITIYLPALCVFFAPALGIGVGDLAMITPLGGSLNPLIDPIVIIYFIGDYRRGAQYILFGKTSTIRPTQSSPLDTNSLERSGKLAPISPLTLPNQRSTKAYIAT